MLAQKYSEKRFLSGMYVQPKLDGIRALYQNGQFISREGHLWKPTSLVQHRAELMSFVPPDVILDGEFYCHGMPLQMIGSRVSVQADNPHPEQCKIQFNIFDVVGLTPFFDRYVMWARLFAEQFSRCSLAKLTDTFQIQSIPEGDKLFHEYKSKGYEGLMYRHPTEGYATPLNCRRKDMRSFHLLKRKSWQDLDAVVVGFNQGVDIYGVLKDCLGSFQLSYNGKLFSAGSGLSDLQRDKYWRNQTAMLGATVKIKYEVFSMNGIPLKPTIFYVDEPPL